MMKKSFFRGSINAFFRIVDQLPLTNKVMIGEGNIGQQYFMKMKMIGKNTKLYNIYKK